LTCRSGFIFRPATPASLPSDEAGIYQPSWSKVWGKFNEAGIYQPSWSKVRGKFSLGRTLIGGGGKSPWQVRIPKITLLPK
jgi:hypothetical protein